MDPPPKEINLTSRTSIFPNSLRARKKIHKNHQFQAKRKGDAPPERSQQQARARTITHETTISNPSPRARRTATTDSDHRHDREPQLPPRRKNRQPVLRSSSKASPLFSARIPMARGAGNGAAAQGEEGRKRNRGKEQTGRGKNEVQVSEKRPFSIITHSFIFTTPHTRVSSRVASFIKTQLHRSF